MANDQVDLFKLTGFELGYDLVDAPVMEQQNSRHDRLVRKKTSWAARSLDHPGEAGSRERRAPARDEHEARLGLLLALQPPRGAQLVTDDRMRAGRGTRSDKTRVGHKLRQALRRLASEPQGRSAPLSIERPGHSLRAAR
jgi:hypothetical protein